MDDIGKCMSDYELIRAKQKLDEANEQLRQAQDERRSLIEQHRRLDQLSEYLLSLSPEEGKAWINKCIQSSAEGSENDLSEI